MDFPDIRCTEFIEFQISGGVNFLVPMGTTGESVTLTEEEQTEVIKTTVDVANGRVPVLAGFLVGKEALGGLLAGVTVSGVLLALFMANAGGVLEGIPHRVADDRGLVRVAPLPAVRTGLDFGGAEDGFARRSRIANSE